MVDVVDVWLEKPGGTTDDEGFDVVDGESLQVVGGAGSALKPGGGLGCCCCTDVDIEWRDGKSSTGFSHFFVLTFGLSDILVLIK